MQKTCKQTAEIVSENVNKQYWCRIGIPSELHVNSSPTLALLKGKDNNHKLQREKKKVSRHQVYFITIANSRCSLFVIATFLSAYQMYCTPKGKGGCCQINCDTDESAAGSQKEHLQSESNFSQFQLREGKCLRNLLRRRRRHPYHLIYAVVSTQSQGTSIPKLLLSKVNVIYYRSNLQKENGIKYNPTPTNQKVLYAYQDDTMRL